MGPRFGQDTCRARRTGKRSSRRLDERLVGSCQQMGGGRRFLCYRGPWHAQIGTFAESALLIAGFVFTRRWSRCERPFDSSRNIRWRWWLVRQGRSVIILPKLNVSLRQISANSHTITVGTPAERPQRSTQRRSCHSRRSNSMRSRIGPKRNVARCQVGSRDWALLISVWETQGVLFSARARLCSVPRRAHTTSTVL